MPIVVFPSRPDPATAGVTGTAAVERFLDSPTTATTRAGYAETLTRLTAATGPHCPVAALQPEHYAAVMDHWNVAAAPTWWLCRWEVAAFVDGFGQQPMINRCRNVREK
ncbi:hypothetical protein [Streptosporangium pseudovulgare]|uniref:Uncharacterized protein n=1 Tax=Streptosporangium pseudovulgare TaxID=35765 RepID=A0ABQ2RI76_9ACTN|nr:hypothetical protein [Streptosporangium pseudovulgare]GGQ33361.1 hypothetical protein GCM10010140_74290 [Streptosporangium pseudovulgare]